MIVMNFCVIECSFDLIILIHSLENSLEYATTVNTESDGDTSDCVVGVCSDWVSDIDGVNDGLFVDDNDGSIVDDDNDDDGGESGVNNIFSIILLLTKVIYL